MWLWTFTRKYVFKIAVFVTLWAVVMSLAPKGPAQAQEKSGGGKPYLGAPVTPAEFAGDVRSLPYVAPIERSAVEVEVMTPAARMPQPSTMRPEEPVLAPNAMPTPLQSFDGIYMLDTSCSGGQCGGGWPPDTVGDVGLTHYIQAVNTAVAIYNKTGTRLAAFTFNSLWSGASTGTPCDSKNMGDPTVNYDPLADRWIIGDFAFAMSGNNPVAPFYECFAVSKSNDPVSGGWWLYALKAHDNTNQWLNDYPKVGIWPDGVYMSANMFDTSLNYRGVRAWALNRTQMESGATITPIVVDVPGTTNHFSLLPSNMQGAQPPAGTPNYFVGESYTVWGFEVYKFHVDWVTPGSSTFTGPTNVAHASYSYPGENIVPQMGTTVKLASLGERLMMQAQYRNIGGVESLWVVHTALSGAGSTTRLQWGQINVTGGTVNTTIVQQQMYGDTNLWRWMGSLAVDGNGNMAVGFSTSSASANPSIAIAGRLASDTLGTLGQGEATVFAGTASQTNYNRWGDYSAMSVDPADDCTFWYTTEYLASGDTTHWRTRIITFKYPTCTNAPKQSTYIPLALRNYSQPPVQPFTLTEGFEGGVVPPTGWTLIAQNASYTWGIDTSDPHAGLYSAMVEWDFTQDEWLLSPSVNLSSATLTLWSQGSITWCRDDFDYCDLNVYLVVNGLGGGDDIFVYRLEDDWSGDYIWTQTILDLTALLPAGPVQIGFEYVGDDGDTAFIDDISLVGTPR